MSFIDLVTQQAALVLQSSGFGAQEIVVQPLNSSGAGVDLTSWGAWTLSIFDSNLAIAGAGSFQVTPTSVSDSAGKSVLSISQANSASIPVGSWRFALARMNPDTTTLQLVATGPCSVN